MPASLEYEKVTGESAEILNKHFMPIFRTGYVKVKGTVLPKYFMKFGNAIQEMKVRDDDVWVCSFPKTGTTWTQEMVWCISNDLDFERAKINLPSRFPFLEHSPLFDFSKLQHLERGFEMPAYVTDSVKYINEMASPRFVKSHLPFNLLPKQLREGKTAAKIIYCARNAKDTCLSYYHHCQLMEGYEGSFEDFVKLFMDGSLCFAPFWEHVLGFWERQSEDNILFLKYEDMKKDLPSVIRQTALFLEKDLNREQVEVLAKHLSFESMKANPAVNYEDVIEIFHTLKLTQAEGSFMRSGQVGQWKEKMNPDLIQKFNVWAENKVAGTDLTL